MQSSSATSASEHTQQPHRQHLVDQILAAVQSGTSPGRSGPSWAVQLTLDAPGSYGRRVADDFAARYAGLLARFHCVDRIVLNAYYPIGNTAGGFRTWWRRLIGGPDAAADAVLDNTHLMRLAGGSRGGSGPGPPIAPSR